MTIDWQHDPAGAVVAFRQDGFIALPGFLDANEVAEIFDNTVEQTRSASRRA